MKNLMTFLLNVFILLLLIPIALKGANIWGRLANPGFENQPIKSTFFFTGNWRNGVQFYEYNPDPNTGLYTIHPLDSCHLGWSENVAFREFAVDVLVEAGVNVVNMSFWGSRGTDNWVKFAPMQTSTYSHDELFDVSLEKDILIAPYIESYDSGDVSPEFLFRDSFPGTPENPAPEFVTHIKDLIDRYLTNPQNSNWPDKWAQVYDQTGEKRYLISIIHVASNQTGMTNQLFAEGFDHVADKIFEDTEIRVGFTLDALPPNTYAFGDFKATPLNTGTWLIQQNSVIAISCYIPEVWIGSSDEAELYQWKRQFSLDWINTGIPFILDLSSGYDAQVVFPGSPIWGNNSVWRDYQDQLINDLEYSGMTFNAWNGYTEGYAGMETLQYGDTTFNWIKEIFTNYGPTTDVNHTVSDQPREYTLCQNYPNPFNQSTTINFDVNKTSWISLKIYDIQGRKISMLINEQLDPGRYHYKWSTDKIASGIYFYQLKSQQFSMIKKAILLK